MGAWHGSHSPGTHGWSRLLVAAALVIVLITSLEANPAAASGRPCRVTDTAGGQTYARLQQAVNGARSGARLTVTGVCHGGTVIDKDLVIEGSRTRTSGPPTLSGHGRTRVLDVHKGATVRLLSLVIMRGEARWGGGIRNMGRLVLRDVHVRRCSGEGASSTVGGVFNTYTGRLTMNGASSIAGNDIGDWGVGPGGVWNKGTFRMNGRSSIAGSTKEGPFGAGGSGVWNEGTFTMSGSSSIRGNSDYGVQNQGPFTMNGSSSIHGNHGGVWSTATFTMNDSSSIHGNHGVDAGAGIFVAEGASLTLNGSSSISGNTAGRAGGGVYVAPDGILTMNDHSAIRDNTTKDGGGLLVTGGHLTLNDSSSISGNTASDRAGGVYLYQTEGHDPQLTMTGASAISGNTANSRGGGGIWHNPLHASLVGVSCGPQTYANVYANTPDDCHAE